MNAKSCGPAWLDEKFADGGIVILDGAMGTELQALGVPMHTKVWSATAMLTHPDTVRQAHINYIEAGAEVIITNTFAAGRHMLEPAGLGDEVANITRTAVRLAREARDSAATTPVAIVGSMCEWVHIESRWTEPGNLRDAMTEHAHLLAGADVDAIALEMAQRSSVSPIAVEAALSPGLPVWAGMSCSRRPGYAEVVTFDEPYEPFDPIVRQIAESRVAMINVMHSPIADTSHGLEIVRRHWDGPVGTYPESGYFTMPDWNFVDIIDPDDLVTETRAWVEAGARLVGGCCGLGPSHIAALKQAFG